MITLDQVKSELELHFKQVDAILAEMESYLPLSECDFEDVEKLKTIDSFILRFVKIQDRMGEKLFPALLETLGEYKSNMSLIDVLHRLEKLELINSSDEWIDYRKLRNSLTHEYPNNRKEIAETIKLAVDVYKTMREIYSHIIKR